MTRARNGLRAFTSAARVSGRDSGNRTAHLCIRSRGARRHFTPRLPIMPDSSALWMDGGMVGGKRLLSKEAIARILTPVSPMKSLGTDKPYPCGFFGLKPHYGQLSMLYASGERPTQTDVRAFGHGGSDGTGGMGLSAEDLIVCYFTQSRGQVSTIRLETTIQDALLRARASLKCPMR